MLFYATPVLSILSVALTVVALLAHRKAPLSKAPPPLQKWLNVFLPTPSASHGIYHRHHSSVSHMASYAPQQVTEALLSLSCSSEIVTLKPRASSGLGPLSNGV